MTSAALLILRVKPSLKCCRGERDGRDHCGKSFEQFRPATEMYLSVRYETPAFLSPIHFQLAVGPQAADSLPAAVQLMLQKVAALI